MSNDSRHPAFLNVKTALLLHVPFFASLLLDIMQIRVGKFPHIFPQGIDKQGNVVPIFETMATDGKTIYIDEDFIKGLAIEHAVFCVCHEISHAMWGHMDRGKRYHDTGFDGKPFNPMLWNIAADYDINDMLVKAKIGKIKLDKDGKPEWLLNAKYTCEMSVEEVYRDLLKNPPPKGQGQDQHIFDLGNLSDAELKRAVQSAAEAAKAMGKLPAELERFTDNLLAPQISWKELLRTTVVTQTSRDTQNWARPHRRRLAGQGIYLARPAAYGCDCIVVAVDTSGSIDDDMIRVFFSELADIIRTCRPETVWLLGVDSRVASVEELPGDVDISDNPPKVKGGGGTDFNPPFKWMEESDIRPDTFVYFTDLQGPGPKEEPGFPVVWCSITPELKGEIGQTIYINLAAD